jgi:maltoporin
MFQKKFNTDTDGPKWDANFMVGGYDIFPNHDLTPQVKQLYVSGHDLGDGVLKGATFWAGKRYYERVATGINDLFLLMGDGDGFGVDGLDFGFGRFSYAMMYRGRGDNNTGTVDHLLKMTDIQSNADGNLSVYLSLRQDSTSDKVDVNGNVTDPATNRDIESGYALTLIHRQGLDGASNLFGLQYGKGSLSNLNLSGGGFGAGLDKSSSVVRITDEINFYMGQTNLAVLGLYQKSDNGQGTQTTWYEFGLRPHYAFNDVWGVSWEMGYDAVKETNADRRNLLKNTLALTIRNGGNEVPHIRVFYTFAKWNEAAKNTGNGPVFGWLPGTTNPFANKTSGSSFGVQGEVWF